MFLIDDLLMLPIDGMKFVFRTLAKAAEEQYTDDAPVKQQLLELQVQLENGDISEEQYVVQEAGILRQLREIENHRREVGGAPPEEERGPLTGKVSAGSSASVNLGYGPSEKK